MMTIFSHNTRELVNERRRELLRDAENFRLASQLRSVSPRAPFLQRVMRTLQARRAPQVSLSGVDTTYLKDRLPAS